MGILGKSKLTETTTFGRNGAPAVRCPICAWMNEPGQYCRHVRWTFDQGDPVDFASFALETSPYVHARGRKPSEISPYWWQEHGEWVTDLVVTMFHAQEGYVFGELGDLDILARHLWKRYCPDPVKPAQLRYDP